MRRLALVVFSFALLATACPETPPAGGDGGTDAGPVLCASNDQCPAELPVCSGGVCTAEDEGCSDHSECPSGVCDLLTGACQPCTDCCESEVDCVGGATCVEGHCVAQGGPCTDVDDCDVGQTCQGGFCAPFIPTAACATDADCPRDHQCNAMGDARCEGCLNDAFCIDSPHGPKCDTNADDGQGPGLGYCFAECGTGIGDCPLGAFCDVDRGGICVPACSVNADCQTGLVCKGGKCEACQANDQCAASEICQQGMCVTNPGCNDAACQTNLGLAYYCDTTTNQCRKGCTETGCDTANAEDCNPCVEPSTCDAGTHACSGSTCDPTCNGQQCEMLMQVCDTVTCTCAATGGGGGGTGQEGEGCLTDKDCAGTMACFGEIAMFGIPGTCEQACTQAGLCLCEDPSRTCSSMLTCAIGVAGRCE